MNKKIIIVCAFAFAISAAFYSVSYLSAENKSSSDEINISDDNKRVDMPDLKGWPSASQKAAKEMEAKYGKPNGVTPDMLIWNNNGMWLKTIVYKKEMKHDFPKPHTDVMEQWINYRVPLNSYDELALYDGSITANRTNGTISARCDKEAMNILALNLAYDIMSNGKTVDNARMDYGKDAMAFMGGDNPVTTQKLNFSNDKSAPDIDKPLDIMMEKTGMGGK